MALTGRAPGLARNGYAWGQTNRVMDEPLEARIDALAQELIRLAHEAGTTIFIAASLHGGPRTDGVLVVSADPVRARQLEGLFDAAAKGWVEERGARAVVESMTGPPAAVSSADDGAVLGMN